MTMMQASDLYRPVCCSYVYGGGRVYMMSYEYAACACSSYSCAFCQLIPHQAKPMWIRVDPN